VGFSIMTVTLESCLTNDVGSHCALTTVPPQYFWPQRPIYNPCFALMSACGGPTPCLKRSATMTPREPVNQPAKKTEREADFGLASSRMEPPSLCLFPEPSPAPEPTVEGTRDALQHVSDTATQPSTAPAGQQSGGSAPGLRCGTSKFRLRPLPPKPLRTVPRASELSILPPGTPSLFAMPDVLKDKLSPIAPLVLGLDVETNDWEIHERIKGSIGEHGFYNICCPADLEARIVQLGWAIHEDTGTVIVERVVRPDGFEISKKASEYHGISQKDAIEQGVALAEALRALMLNVQEVCRRGGRLVAHHLEFDAGIISREMRRAGLDTAEEWSRLVRTHGFCTMCPFLGRWLSQCFGRDAGAETAMNTLKLQQLVKWLVPPEKRVSVRFHTAGADAHMTVEVYLAVLVLGGCR
jgi:DNA polymerase III epsilon subunit-like protein